MKFILEIELSDIVQTPVQVAELLNTVRHAIREDGLPAGPHDINTRPSYRQSADGNSTELFCHTVGTWKVVY